MGFSITKFEKVAGTTNEFAVVWGAPTDTKKGILKYRVRWWYSSSSYWIEVKDVDYTYKPTSDVITYPDNAKKVKAIVYCYYKSYSSGGKTVTPATLQVAKEASVVMPVVPGRPGFQILSGTSVKAYLNNINQTANPTGCQFMLERSDGYRYTAPAVKLVKNSSNQLNGSYVFNTSYGYSYSFSIRVGTAVERVDSNGKGLGTYYLTNYTEWSEFSLEHNTKPDNAGSITKTVGISDGQIIVYYDKVAGAKEYEVECAKDKSYFTANPSAVKKFESFATSCYCTGLDAGIWYFRYRATNDVGEGGWSGIVSGIVGSTPEPPTTWSESSVVVSGEDAIIYWVHNSEDGSEQTKAEISINNQTVIVSGNIQTYKIPTGGIADSDDIVWAVRTAGATGVYGDFSTFKKITVYNAPSVLFSFDDVVTSYPINVSAITSPPSQKCIGYHVSIISRTTYKDYGFDGKEITVNAGSVVYDKYFQTEMLDFDMNPYDANLSDNAEYTIVISATMDSGLLAVSYFDFRTEITRDQFDIMVDAVGSESDLSVSLNVSCYNEKESGEYTDDDRADVLISVYRKAYDGEFVLVEDNIENDGYTWVTDLHPELNYSEYRVVVIGNETGNLSYKDVVIQETIPNFLQTKNIVFNWNERVNGLEFNPDTQGESEIDGDFSSGSMLELKYNIDVSEQSTPEVNTVNYIGRKHPVSYYGTQSNSKATWSALILASDTESLKKIRNMKDYFGDVYVREPTGAGYWANVNVTINTITHNTATIPVSFSITRVEGGA